MGQDPELVRQFERLGVNDPEGWARSEREEGIPQLARAAFLRGVWDELDRWEAGAWVDRWSTDPNLARRPEGDRTQQVVRAMVAAGITPAQIATLASAVAHEAVFDVLYRIDEGCDPDLDPAFPGWRLVEVDGETEQPTGRDVSMLHEDVLTR